jgi:hypothetical protein
LDLEHRTDANAACPLQSMKIVYTAQVGEKTWLRSR